MLAALDLQNFLQLTDRGAYHAPDIPKDLIAGCVLPGLLAHLLVADGRDRG